MSTWIFFSLVSQCWFGLFISLVRQHFVFENHSFLLSIPFHWNEKAHYQRQEFLSFPRFVTSKNPAEGTNSVKNHH